MQRKLSRVLGFLGIQLDRRGAFNLVGLLLLVMIALFVRNMFTADRRVRAECEMLTPGMTVNDLNTFAETHGLAPPVTKQSGTAIVVESKTFGRYGCRVELDAGRIKNVSFDASD
jgi:hypothetical protein